MVVAERDDVDAVQRKQRAKVAAAARADADDADADAFEGGGAETDDAVALGGLGGANRRGEGETGADTGDRAEEITTSVGSAHKEMG